MGTGPPAPGGQGEQAGEDRGQDGGVHDQPQAQGDLADLGAVEEDEADVVVEGYAPHALVVAPDSHRSKGELVPGQSVRLFRNAHHPGS
jgi:hypothetical protein